MALDSLCEGLRRSARWRDIPNTSFCIATSRFRTVRKP
jgi:hypothetical protein